MKSLLNTDALSRLGVAASLAQREETERVCRTVRWHSSSTLV